MNSTTLDDWYPCLASDGLRLSNTDGVLQGPRPDARGTFGIWISTREATDGAFPVPVALTGNGPASQLNTDIAATPFISTDWPATGSALYWAAHPSSDAPLAVLDIHQAEWIQVPEPATFFLRLQTFIGIAVLQRRERHSPNDKPPK